jgi:hypothetical protein
LKWRGILDAVTPRGTDWSLAVLVAAGVASGLATWFAGEPRGARPRGGRARLGRAVVERGQRVRRGLQRAGVARRARRGAAGLPGAERRFTGSYDAGSFTGNDFPSTSCVADDPRPGAGPLTVAGRVRRDLALSVVPGRRGFKWVERIEVHEDPDPGALPSTVLSSFSAAGRGRRTGRR